MALSTKTMLFVCLLVAAVAIVPAAAQLFPVIEIGGNLTCSANLTAIGTPPLMNVTVQLRCGPGNGSLVASAVTNSEGQFSIMLGSPISTLPQLLSGCTIRVYTPIANCNATVPSVNGILISPLTIIAILTRIINNIFYRIILVGPTAFA